MLLKKVVEALVDYKVKYVLVGGHAVALHGAVRGTVDVDIVIQLSEKSFANCETALQSIGLQGRLPVTAKDVFKFRKEYIENRNLIAWSFVNPVRPSEVVDVIITHGAEEMKANTKKVGSLSVQIASIPDLIAMKKQSGRPQDLEDIRALEKLK